MDIPSLLNSPASSYTYTLSAQLWPEDDSTMEVASTTSDPWENGHYTPAESPQPSEITGGTSEGADVIDDEDENENEDKNANGDDDMASVLSVGGDLQDDLEEVLNDKNFSFEGTFYHAGLLTAAPNPCLHISGLGFVGLPLSDRDAKCIVSCATLAPFGHGERTLVDKIVRDTWEIEPARVTFANPHWEPYIKSTVVHEVCKSLGVAIGNHPPKMELHKLLLYEKGSHFLPHQDTQKAERMFATVVIILPSPYAGGEVVVSHASTTKTIDFASNSLLSTAILAWYTDVKHAVKEVIAGYRLALSYNLIHDEPSSSTPRYGLPDLDEAVVPLRRILKKWKAGKYNDELDRNLIAYLLDHEYSVVNLHGGFKDLKGVDSQRIKFLRPVAEQLGFRIGLANLEHNVRGDADDCGGGYYRRGRYDSDEEEDSGEPEMAEDIFLGQEELIPKDPFDGDEPDDAEYEGYTGNEAGQLDYWYRRTVLILIPEEKLDDIRYSVEGITYAFQKLKESNAIPPTPWRDLEIWKALMKLRNCSLQVVDVGRLLQAWQLFSFAEVCVNFEELLARSTQLPERMKFIYDDGIVIPWCQKESDKILSSYSVASVEDVPTIMTVILMAGLESFKRIVLPNLFSKKDNYDFWIAFIKSLRDGKPQPTPTAAATDTTTDTLAAKPASQTAVEHPPTQGADAVDSLIKECLQAAALRWSEIPPPSLLYSYYASRLPQTKPPRSIASSRLSKEPLQFPRLRSLLIEKQQDLLSSPFVEFFQVLIGLYLKDILVDKNHRNVRLRKLGCGCQDCGRLDTFILDPKSSTTTFWIAQGRRTHLEGRVMEAQDLCTFTTIRTGSPHGLQITKQPKVVQESTWEGRQKAAKAFLASIGTDVLIARIMGARYLEVLRAMEGAGPSGSTKNPSVAPSVVGTSRVPQPTTASSTAKSSAPRASTTVPNSHSASSQVAGKKRKNVIQLGPVIDLTEED
ncbi:hypothetical protein CPB84DRAFT_1767012 [Gymnopilus junonius]|uniref:Prolyl 4-hydroxylase alpha subunit Fe(2+) 2OG dioxygenase domain-containing protein n=1 Tax=Gymnopilus junonius TaxID=109634 RepID=A0A9P5NVZ7_GYMJU|nr:hypothetical protein CPB84DRAFT_1767012 [Gymnopilus junonius]